eukprot:scaffold144161_cov30-Prasinocladus_malaysianus.AAC.1
MEENSAHASEMGPRDAGQAESPASLGRSEATGHPTCLANGSRCCRRKRPSSWQRRKNARAGQAEHDPAFAVPSNDVPPLQPITQETAEFAVSPLVSFQIIKYVSHCWYYELKKPVPACLSKLCKPRYCLMVSLGGGYNDI